MRSVVWWSLVACGGANLEGTWQGECAVETEKGEQTYGIVYELGKPSGDAVTGQATVDSPFLTEPIDGAVLGTVDGDTVVLDAELGDAVLGFSLRHDTTYDRVDGVGTLTGACSVQIGEESAFEGSGTLTLEEES